MSSFSLERYWLISLSSVHAQLQTLVTPWTVACQAPLFMKFSRQEYWSELSFPTTGDLLHPGMNLGLLNWQVDSLPLSHLRSPSLSRNCSNLNSYHQYISSVQSLSHVQLFATSWTAARQASPFSPTPGACSKTCTLSWWCHPIISSSDVPFVSCLQSFPAIWSFPMSHFFASSDQVFEFQVCWNSFSFSISPSNKYSGLISFRIDWLDLLPVQGTLKSLLQHTVQKHQFFGTQLSLWSNSHIHIWLLEKPYLWLDGPLSIIERWSHVSAF